jgi:hypothetical protein
VSALSARTEDRVVVASEEGPCVHIHVPESDDLPPGTAARVLKLRGECVLVVRNDLQPSAAATAVEDEACDHDSRLSDERAVVQLRLVREDVCVRPGPRTACRSRVWGERRYRLRGRSFAGIGLSFRRKAGAETTRSESVSS